MAGKKSATAAHVNGSTLPSIVSLGDNPVNAYQARLYAQESSPSCLAVINELTENARDNATDVVLMLDIAAFRVEKSTHVLTLKKIACRDNGTSLTHSEFLNRFCGAYSDSDGHRETHRAGRNGVGTKTYTSIAEFVRVRATTGRATEGLDQDRPKLLSQLPSQLSLPRDGEADSIWRVYEFRLHTRSAIPCEWTTADPQEMGTTVELCGLHDGAEVCFETLIERLSYSRDWLEKPAHSFTVQLSGEVPDSLANRRRISLRPWSHPTRDWLTKAQGNCSDRIWIFDPTSKEREAIDPPSGLSGSVEFDFRVVGKSSEGQMQNLDKPALLLEICGALPYAPNLEGGQSSRTLPLLTFLGLEHASSIGAFCNAVCGWARINTLQLKDALRNNKTTLASGPGMKEVGVLRAYLHKVLLALHRAWYNATRSSADSAVNDVQREAEVEVNLALQGVNRNPFRTGDIKRGPKQDDPKPPVPPARHHRWECGSCRKRWLAETGFQPDRCAERSAGAGQEDGCGSTNIGLAKNQPRIGDCQIRIEQLGDRKVPAVFQFDKEVNEVDLPVVIVNLASPRYVELRGAGSLSGQAQKRLKQYLVDASLVAIAEYNVKVRGTDFSEEWGELYYNRMLRLTGVKQYESHLGKVIGSSDSETENSLLAAE